MWNAAVPAGQYADDSGPSMVRHGKAAPSRFSVRARSWAWSSVACRHCSASRTAPGWVYVSTGSTNISVSQNAWPSYPGPVRPLAEIGRRSAAGAGLEHVEEAEPDGLLHLRVAFDPHVGGVPERVEVFPLRPAQPVPAVEPGRGERRADLVAQRRQRPAAGPAVREVLDHAQLLAGLEHAADGGADPVLVPLALDRGAFGAVHVVAHGGGDPQAADLGPVDEQAAVVGGQLLLGLQR